MSVRAYAVEEVKLREGGSTFNLWHEEAITDWLQEHTNFYELLNDDANGMTEVAVEDWEKMLAEIGSKLEQEQVASIKADIDWAKARNQEYIQYDCF